MPQARARTVHWLRTTAEGRGRRYTRRRGWVESVLRQLYRTDWPARLWSLVPGAVQVEVARHEVAHVRGGTRLRIGFASDLHVGPTTPLALLEQAMDRLGELNADVLLLGGDFVFLDASEHTEAVLVSLLRRLPKRVPKFAVLGNHDLWTRHRFVERALARADVRLLCNEWAHLPPPLDDVVVGGLDDPWTGEPDGARTLPVTPGLKIGLCHAPDGIAELLDRDPCVMLCGHTHGGQIALPGGRPIVLPPGPHSRAMPRGRFAVGATTVVVSKGVGTTELPVRTFATPEVLCVDLVPAPG